MKAWDIEREKRTKQTSVFKQYVADQQKNLYSVKTGLERQVGIYEAQCCAFLISLLFVFAVGFFK